MLNLVAGGAIVYDVLDDGHLRTSSIVNGVLLGASIFFPPTAIFVVGYGAADLIFNISGNIDNNHGGFQIFNK